MPDTKVVNERMRTMRGDDYEKGRQPDPRVDRLIQEVAEALDVYGDDEFDR